MFLPLKVKAVLRAITKTVADARQVGREVLGDAVSEIILARITRKVGEWQHHDGKMRPWPVPVCSLHRPRSVRSKEIPSAARNHDECDDPCGEWRQDRTLLRLRGFRPVDGFACAGLPTSSE